MGKITGYQARLYVKENYPPKFFKAWRIPFALEDRVDEELDKQAKEGLLVQVNTSEWATPIVVVQKRERKVRICGDYKITINPGLLVDDYPLPTIEELFSTMAGGCKFTKIFLYKAYLQLEIHPDYRHLLTLNYCNFRDEASHQRRRNESIDCLNQLYGRFVQNLSTIINPIQRNRETNAVGKYLSSL